MYDVLIIGGGPGGYLAAQRAGENGLSAVLFEKRNLGGVCLNEGCVPSKALLNSAKIYEHAADGSAYGVTTENAQIDQKAVIKRKNKVVKMLVNGVAMTMKRNKVEVVEAKATIKNRLDGIITVEADGKEYQGKNLIIASGSDVVKPPIPGLKEGLESGFVLTSREILDLEEIPKSMVIVGGGVIGLEMASYFQTVGSKVTVIEMLDHIAGTVDSDLSKLLQKNFEAKGLEFKLSSPVTGFGEGYVEFEADGKKEKIEADYCLISIGRYAVSQDIGLDKIGVECDRNNIIVDDQCLTNVPNVYAIGDVNGKWMLAHAAYREAEVAVNTILGKKDLMRYEAMPSVLYTNPEMSFVGESEQSAKEKGLDYRALTIPLAYSGRYVAEVERGNGVIKLLVDNKRNYLIGAHMLGSYASELVIPLGMMIEKQMTIDEIKEFIFPHPTVGEAIREAIFAL
ncbi:MAG: dihydrolipoyl dehydrogenase [Bacillota bacterium]|jgi:dihydrolipoamide dehydrogenase|nr:dihydrolipoyl dehydrogenase [Bacillota bacterium]